MWEFIVNIAFTKICQDLLRFLWPLVVLFGVTRYLNIVWAGFGRPRWQFIFDNICGYSRIYLKVHQWSICEYLLKYIRILENVFDKSLMTNLKIYLEIYFEI